MTKILKGSTGSFYKEGSGFTATQNNATRLSDEQADEVLSCASKFGFSATAEEVSNKSFAVCYLRKTDFNEDGTINPNQLNPSRRRFATRAGAATHGRRFNVRKASYGAAPGSAGHVGFYVIETNDPVNSAINLATGLTVPTNGAPKTFAARQAAGAAFLPVKDVLGISVDESADESEDDLVESDIDDDSNN